MVNQKWDKEMDDKLIMFVIAGHTLSDIARTLGKSRNAISGRMHRLRKTRPDDIPAANTLPIEEIAARNSRAARSKAKKKTTLKTVKPKKTKNTPPVKPVSSPTPFNQLGKGKCTYCVEGLDAPASPEMMCCGDDVVDALAREGDRRRSHCEKHYQVTTDRSSSAKRFIKNNGGTPAKRSVANVS